MRNLLQLPDDFLSCLGVALSPGNLAIALVRSFNIDLLNPMYQARSQKAAVEFLWNGAQQTGELEDLSETITEAILGFSKNEFAYWESNLLWSLKELKDLNKPLVLWDIVAAMLAFKQSMPEFVELVITKWLSVSYLGFYADIPMEDLAPKISKCFPAVPSRLLHILNVISRRVMLSELKSEEINRKVQDQRRKSGEEEIDLWLKLLEESERELRERLVGLSFSAYQIAESSLGAWNWRPAGLAQLQQWVEINHDIVHTQLQTLSAEVKSSLTRSSNSRETALEEEKCPYCVTPVPFHSPEEAFCQSQQQIKKKSKEQEKGDQRHKLERCCVSMQVCPPTPLWFCKCCNRMTLEQAPETFFALPSFPSDLRSFPESSFRKVASKPFCPLCGILLQRKQPEFLLSASPV